MLPRSAETPRAHGEGKRDRRRRLPSGSVSAARMSGRSQPTPATPRRATPRCTRLEQQARALALRAQSPLLQARIQHLGDPPPQRAVGHVESDGFERGAGARAPAPPNKRRSLRRPAAATAIALCHDEGVIPPQFEHNRERPIESERHPDREARCGGDELPMATRGAPLGAPMPHAERQPRA